MRQPARLCAVLGLVIVLVALPGPAQASHNYEGIVPTDNYDMACLNATMENARVCRTDNANLYWYADSATPGELEANDMNALRTMLANEYVPTDLALTYETNPVFSGDAETDVIYQETESGFGLPEADWLGVTWCNGAAIGWYECDQTYIRIVAPDGYRRSGASIACHETGHAVGLVHGANASPQLDNGDNRLGCMENEDEFPSDLGAASTHLINVTY